MDEWMDTLNIEVVTPLKNYLALPPHMHNQDKFEDKVLLNDRFVFLLLFRFVFEIKHSIEIMLFLYHKMTFLG